MHAPPATLQNLANLLWAYAYSEVVDAKLLAGAKACMLNKPVWTLQVCVCVCVWVSGCGCCSA